jgi:hypothetical protein
VPLQVIERLGNEEVIDAGAGEEPKEAPTKKLASF